MSKEAEDFFINQTADIKTFPVKKQVLDVALFAYGVFDGATISIQVSPDDLNSGNPDAMAWFDHPAGMFTDATQTEKHFWNNADFSEVYMRAVLLNTTLNTIVSFKMRPRVEMAI